MNLISRYNGYHAELLREMMPNTFTTFNESPEKHDRNYFFGAFDDIHSGVRQCIRDGKITHVHFVGSDAVRLTQNKREHIPLYLNKNIRVAVHSEWLSTILGRYGIKSKVVTTGPLREYKITPYPKNPTMAFYMGRANGPYILKMLIHNALHNPSVDFIIYGNREDVNTHNLDNIKVLGWRPMDEIISKSSALLRYTVWDGFSQSVIEMAMSGRNIVSNIPYPLRVSLTEAIENKEPNIPLSDYYSGEYSVDKTVERVLDFIGDKNA